MLRPGQRTPPSQADCAELESITALIQKLTIRKQELQRRINRNQDEASLSSVEFVDANTTNTPTAVTVPIQATTVSETESRPFRIGDCVFVLSNYKGRYGTVGIIKELSPKFAYIKSDRYNHQIQVQRVNLRHHHE